MFDELIQALLTVSDNVGHYKAMKKEPPYIVWAEDNQGDVAWADGKMQNQVIEGTIDYYLDREDDEAIFRMQEALDEIDISYRYESTQYEADTGWIHHEWVWQIGA